MDYCSSKTKKKRTAIGKKKKEKRNIRVILKEEYARNVVEMKRQSQVDVCEGRYRGSDDACCQRLCLTIGL